jgi:hypothetical protein
MSNSSSQVLTHFFHKPATNITTNLLTRCVVGSKLSIAIHQHYGKRLHLVWLGTGGIQEAALERLFLWFTELDNLCTGVQKSLPEGVCGCVFDAYCPLPKGVALCVKRTPADGE